MSADAGSYTGSSLAPSRLAILYFEVNLEVSYHKYVSMWHSEYSFSYLQSPEGEQGVHTTENMISIYMGKSGLQSYTYKTNSILLSNYRN